MLFTPWNGRLVLWITSKRERAELFLLSAVLSFCAFPSARIPFTLLQRQSPKANGQEWSCPTSGRALWASSWQSSTVFFTLSSHPLQEKYPLESMDGRELVLPLDYQDMGQGSRIAKIQPEGGQWLLQAVKLSNILVGAERPSATQHWGLTALSTLCWFCCSLAGKERSVSSEGLGTSAVCKASRGIQAQSFLLPSSTSIVVRVWHLQALKVILFVCFF